MYAQPVTVRYADGTSTDLVLTQWAIGQFAQFAQSRGWNVDPANPGLISMVMVRYQAYCELHRDPTKPKPSFDKWDATVNEVEVADEEAEVTPTETVTSVA